jgi:hypothetical protein
MPSGPDDVLVTGLLLDPMTMQLVQVTAGLPAALRPNPGAELVTVADPSSPGTVGIAWGQAADGSSAAPSPLSQGWDPGPGGMHAQAVAAWLAEQGLTPSDFGGMLEVLAPGMTQLLDAACSRYFTVIPGQTSTAVMQTGEPAQGVVTAARVLPIPPQVLPSPQACMALLTLQITPQRGAPYSVTIRQGFRSPERFTQLATVGTRLPLRRDPANPSVVALDNAALPAG